MAVAWCSHRVSGLEHLSKNVARLEKFVLCRCTACFQRLDLNTELKLCGRRFGHAARYMESLRCKLHAKCHTVRFRLHWCEGLPRARRCPSARRRCRSSLPLRTSTEGCRRRSRHLHVQYCCIMPPAPMHRAERQVDHGHSLVSAAQTRRTHLRRAGAQMDWDQRPARAL